MSSEKYSFNESSLMDTEKLENELAEEVEKYNKLISHNPISEAVQRQYEIQDKIDKGLWLQKEDLDDLGVSADIAKEYLQVADLVNVDLNNMAYQSALSHVKQANQVLESINLPQEYRINSSEYGKNILTAIDELLNLTNKNLKSLKAIKNLFKKISHSTKIKNQVLKQLLDDYAGKWETYCNGYQILIGNVPKQLSKELPNIFLLKDFEEHDKRQAYDQIMEIIKNYKDMVSIK